MEAQESKALAHAVMPYTKPLSLLSAVTVWTGILIAVAAPKNVTELLSQTGITVTQSWLSLSRVFSAVPSYAIHGVILYVAGVSLARLEALVGCCAACAFRWGCWQHCGGMQVRETAPAAKR